jgi:NAD(P)-dependent dehydrogenase (short-subunit alcohol dehydrogenase family)
MSTPAQSRVWFITGTSSGLGLALTEAALAAGERVVATLRNPSSLAQLQQKYSSTQLLILRLDVSNAGDIKAAVKAAVDHFETIDIVVNNAGYAIFGEAEAVSDEDARKLFDVQYWGPVNVMREVSTRFLRVFEPTLLLTIILKTAGIFRGNKSGGRYFNISTAGGYSANPAISHYNASKFGLFTMISPFGCVLIAFHSP